MQDRGIIIDPVIKEVDVKSRIVSANFKPDLNIIRQGLLYFDKIAFPENNCLHIPYSADMLFLQSAGIAQKTVINFGPGSYDGAGMYAQTQLAAFKQLNQTNPSMWTMSSHINRIKNFIPISEESESKMILEMSLNNVLPMPPDGTPFPDILELKQKRKDEFTALRVAVDEFSDYALKWDAIPRGKDAAILRLDQAIKDIQKIVDLSWLHRRVSCKLEFNILDAIAYAEAGSKLGATTTHFFGMPDLENIDSAVGAAAGIGLSMIKVGGGFGQAINFPEACKNFSAFYYIEKEFPGTLKGS